MKFHFALLVMLCAHASARNEIPVFEKNGRGATRMRWEDLKSKHYPFFGPITKGSAAPYAAAVVVKKTQPNQSSGASLMSRCPSAIDAIDVGVQGIVAKNGVEYTFLHMTADNLANCFESYNNTALQASDLVSCCDAAAKGGYNAFRFEESVCTGFTAWLSPIYTACTGEGIVSSGLFVAKQKLSNFTSTAPSFASSSRLTLARILVEITNIVDVCPYSKTLKVTTYSKTETVNLDYLYEGAYKISHYSPELCDDSSSTDKRTVTISFLDGDESVLASVTEVLSSGLTGRHLLSNGVCVLHDSSPLRNFSGAISFCSEAYSAPPFGDGFHPFDVVLQKLTGLAVQVMDFWTCAGPTPEGNWAWILSERQINMSSFNVASLSSTSGSAGVLANVTDKLLYLADAGTVLNTVCIDAPYIENFAALSV